MSNKKFEFAEDIAEALQLGGFENAYALGEQIYFEGHDDLLLEVVSRDETFGPA